MSALVEVITYTVYTVWWFHDTGLLSLQSNSSQPSSPYDLVKFYLEHPVSLKFSPDTSTSGGSVMGLCQVAVQVVLQNCSHHKVKVCVHVLIICNMKIIEIVLFNLQAMVELLQPKDGGHNDPKRYKYCVCDTRVHHMMLSICVLSFLLCCSFSKLSMVYVVSFLAVQGSPTKSPPSTGVVELAEDMFS